MRTTMDAAGRLVIPKEIRRAGDLKPGVPLEVRFSDGRVEIVPEPMPVRLVRKGRVTVMAPKKDVPPLSEDTVERIRRELRTSRKG